jgi:hypothetical protein
MIDKDRNLAIVCGAMRQHEVDQMCRLERQSGVKDWERAAILLVSSHIFALSALFIELYLMYGRL